MLGLGGFHLLAGKAKPPRHEGTWAEAIGNTNPVGGLGALRRAGLRSTLTGLVPISSAWSADFLAEFAVAVGLAAAVCSPPTPERGIELAPVAIRNRKVAHRAPPASLLVN
jgi:hypothetical protein